MNLVRHVYETAQKQPTKTAYHFMGENTSYAAFDQAVSMFATALESRGIQRGDHIALLLGNTPHFLIALYGSMRIGATVIPINPTYSPDEIAYILYSSDAKAVIAIDALLPFIEQEAPQFARIEFYVVCELEKQVKEQLEALPAAIQSRVVTFEQLIQTGQPNRPPIALDEEETALILYTSGTLGQPKGAMLTHKNLYSNARDVGEYLNFLPGDRVVAALPVFHVFALTVVVNAPLLQGATVLLVPRFSPKEVFELIRKEAATVFAGVPTMYNFLYQFPEGKREDFATIRLAISGGSSLPISLLHQFEEKFHVRVSEGYGLSEASPVTCFNPLDRERVPGSIGMSIVNVENKVVDENGQEVPRGEVGELIVRGPNVMKGYYKMPEETAKAIRDGWLYTGDLAKQDEEGYFYIVDRKKEMIIVGGFNVYPREVEEVLFAHPDVVEAAVIGVPDANLGEVVRAFVVLKEQVPTTEEALRAYCEKHLAKYKVPKEIEFLNELPKNTTGKIMRRALQKNNIPSTHLS